MWSWTEVEHNHWASLLQQHLSAKRLLTLTDSWAWTHRAVHWTERVGVKQSSYHKPPSNIYSLVLLLFPWMTSGNLPKWESNLPKEHWQSAHGDGGAAAVVLGMALLKTCTEQALVIIASYPLLKKINALARNIVVRLCCTLIWEVFVIKSIGEY